jgi:SAM-dependent methyltransferase
MSATRPEPPIPPRRLAARVGGDYEDYLSIGAQQRVFIEGLLPPDWSYEGRAVLDFGCGAGRTLSAFRDVADSGRFSGCDIHAESIAWAQRELSPPFDFFVCEETPPLPVPAQSFDLVYAMSVFTHLTHEWSGWLAELHRVLAPGGLALISVLGPAMAGQILGRAWDARTGIAMVDLHKHWDIGGPSVLISEWWLREHWGRAFEVLAFQAADPAHGPGHDLVLLRRREKEVTPAQLAARDPTDPREVAALEYNLELLLEQQERLGRDLRSIQRSRSHDARALLKRGIGSLRRRRA